MTFNRIGTRPTRKATLVRHGINVIRTEADTLDEALDILHQRGIERSQKLRSADAPRKMNLKQEFGLLRGRTQMKNVTLSDRVVAGRRLPKHGPRYGKNIYWTREQVVTAFATGQFTYGELALRAKVNKLEVVFWIHGKTKPPITWRCLVCDRPNSSATQAKNGIDSFCVKCGCFWWEGLPVRAD